MAAPAPSFPNLNKPGSARADYIPSEGGAAQPQVFRQGCFHVWIPCLSDQISWFGKSSRPALTLQGTHPFVPLICSSHWGRVLCRPHRQLGLTQNGSGHRCSGLGAREPAISFFFCFCLFCFVFYSRYNSHNKRLTILKCTIQGHLVHFRCHASVTSI